MFYTYILKCSDNTFYVGSTNDLDSRLHAHNFLKSGAHYTKIRRPVTLVYREEFKTLKESRAREAEIKRMKRGDKIKIINSKTMNTSKNTIEIIVRLICKKDNKILLCKNNEHGHYYLPGGHVEFGDTLEETIYKEMNEELGLEKNQIQNIQFIKYFENSYGSEENKKQEINFIFNIDIETNTELKSLEDHISFEWINEHDLSSVNLLPKGII